MSTPESDRELYPLSHDVRTAKESGDMGVSERLSELRQEAEKSNIKETEFQMRLRFGSNFRKAS